MFQIRRGVIVGRVLETNIEAKAPDGQNVSFTFVSDCEHIQRLAKRLGTVDAYVEIGEGWNGVIHQAAETTLKGCCSGCVVPSGIFKTMQVEANIALPQTATVKVEKE